MKTLSKAVDLFEPSTCIHYWPNNGNLGDLLIAEATRQYFRRNCISWVEYNPESPPESNGITLVYGGGGRFTSHWGGIERHLTHLTHPRVKRGIILPHSFYEVDYFIRGLDDRHTIICREKRSYEYCCSLKPKATILLWNDMGLQLSIADLPDFQNVPKLIESINEETRQQGLLLRLGWAKNVLRGVRNSTITSIINRKKVNVAFILRTDIEKSNALASPMSYDISQSWVSSCQETPYNAYFIRVFAEALSYPDVIVTDRLHVGIMAHHCGKEVYLLDNDYGKLSGVYNQSLSDSPKVHLLSYGELTKELAVAWKKFNSPVRIISHKITVVISKAKNSMKQVVKHYISALKNSIKRLRLNTLRNIYKIFCRSNMAETELMFASHQMSILSSNYKLYTAKKNAPHRVICYMSANSVSEGLADRLRTILTSFVFADVNGRTFHLYHDKDFKLEEYLIPNEIDWRIKKEDISFGLNRVALIFHWRNSIPKLRWPNREYHMYAAQTLVNLSTPSHLADKYTDGKVFQRLFKLSNRLQLIVDKAMQEASLIENEYIAFHLRFLNFFDPVELRGKVTSTPEQREDMLNKVNSIIEQVHQQQPDKKILLFSDSPSFLAAAHPSYVHVLAGTVGYIAKHGTNQAIVDKTFLDLIVMSKAAAIYSIIGNNIYGGGFSRQAALIADKPYHKIKIME